MILPRARKVRPVRLLARAAALALAFLLGAPAAAPAHEIPARVTVLAFVKPEGPRLRVVMRVPLAAMRDVEWPLRGPGYLDVPRAAPLLADAARLWLAASVEMYEDGTRLPEARVIAARVALPSDRSFERWETAAASPAAPAPAADDLPWSQAMLDVALEYTVRDARSRFALRPTLARLGVRTTTVLRFLPPGGAERAFRWDGDPGLVRLDPRWHQAALGFVRLGVAHILGGLDHLLFLFCLVIPLRRVRPLVGVVTAFTVAHSITLAAAAAGWAPDALWFPPLVELLVALSIVVTALANVAGARADGRWRLAFAFGLAHGFAFSFALRESMQFAGPHLATALFSFNLGVELGQLLVLALAVPALAFLFRRVVAERVGTIILSALVAHTAWHWMLDRGAVLSRYRLTWPAWDLALAASAARGALLAVVCGAALWGLSRLARQMGRADAAGMPNA